MQCSRPHPHTLARNAAAPRQHVRMRRVYRQLQSSCAISKIWQIEERSWRSLVISWLLTDLKDEVGDESVEELRFQRINGKALELTDEDWRELVPLVGERKAIQRRINSFKPKVGSSWSYIVSFAQVS